MHYLTKFVLLFLITKVLVLLVESLINYNKEMIFVNFLMILLDTLIYKKLKLEC